MHTVNNSLFRFMVVGALSTVVNYATFAFFLVGIRMAYIPASIVGYVTGMVLGYFCNRKWSFAPASHMSFKEVVQYISVYLGSLGLNAMSLFVLVEYGGVSPLVGNIFAITISTATNYVGLRYVVFGNYASRATIVKSATHE